MQVGSTSQAKPNLERKTRHEADADDDEFGTDAAPAAPPTLAPVTFGAKPAAQEVCCQQQAQAAVLGMVLRLARQIRQPRTTPPTGSDGHAEKPC